MPENPQPIRAPMQLRSSVFATAPHKTMKILEHGHKNSPKDKAFEATCLTCGCRFSYTSEDILDTHYLAGTPFNLLDCPEKDCTSTTYYVAKELKSSENTPQDPVWKEAKQRLTQMSKEQRVQTLVSAGVLKHDLSLAEEYEGVILLSPWQPPQNRSQDLTEGDSTHITKQPVVDQQIIAQSRASEDLNGG